MHEIHQGDCLDILPTLPDNSIDAVVTDPPYGLGVVKDIEGLLRDWLAGGDGGDHVGAAGFMGREWDRTVPPPVLWREVLRVMKPGAYALVFSGTRTQDLMGLSLRLAGFETVGAMCWVFGAGFPKGLSVGKALDKAAGMEREVVGTRKVYYPDTDKFSPNSKGRNGPSNRRCFGHGIEGILPNNERPITAPATPEAEQWDGYRTQLKPAHEIIHIVRKPLDGTTVENVQRWGCGAFNVDGSRIEVGAGDQKGNGHNYGGKKKGAIFGNTNGSVPDQTTGRYPADLLLTHAHDCEPGEACGESCPVRIMGEQSRVIDSSKRNPRGYCVSGSKDREPGTYGLKNQALPAYGDIGTAARYFWQCYPDPPAPFLYQGKATKKDRTCGGAVSNPHPTVKPRALIKYLINLVMPPSPDAILLDPFGGSGTAAVACAELGRRCVLIERDPEFAKVARDRLATVAPIPTVIATPPPPPPTDRPVQLRLF